MHTATRTHPHTNSLTQEHTSTHAGAMISGFSLAMKKNRHNLQLLKSEVSFVTYGPVQHIHRANLTTISAMVVGFREVRPTT